jgi:hypothetical protein
MLIYSRVAGSGGGDALTSNPLSQFAATTSAQLAGVISDETGSGAAVFATSPTLVTPALGTPASGDLSNCTGFPVDTSGVPLINQIAVFTDADTVVGDAALTFETATNKLGIGASGELGFGAVRILNDSAGTTTLENIDAIDATTEDTIEAAIDTLANLTSAAALATVGTITSGVWNGTAIEGTAIASTGEGGGAKFLREDGDGTCSWQAVAGSGDMILASAQTNTGIKTFLDTTMKLRNVANTFDGYFVNTNTADRIYTLQDAAGTLAFTSDITGTNSGTNTGDQTTIVGITGTKAEFDTAVSNGNIAYTGEAHHDGFSDFVANEHIDHTSVTITVAATTNETTVAEGAQDISASRTFTVGLADNAILPGTGGVEIPQGTTAQRLANEGVLRINTTTGTTEIYRGAAWVDLEATGAEVNDLTASVTWANVPDANVTESSVTQHTAAVVTTSAVTTAGALMDSEVDADIKTLTLPASTTISAFGATLVDDAAASNARTTLGLVIGTDVQAHSAVLDATTASFLTADETKLDGIETSADVTDAVNVAAAGAPIISSGAGVPGSTPAAVGDVYVDTTGDNAYIATGTASSADWDQATGMGGGDALTTDPLSQFAATTSAQLLGVMSDETGSGALVFATSPTLVTPALGTPASGVLTNCTGTAAGLTAGAVSTITGLAPDTATRGWRQIRRPQQPRNPTSPLWAR